MIADEAFTARILESISDGVFTVDEEWKISSFNRAAERITGVPRAQAVGRYCFEVFRSNMCESACPLKRTMKTGKPLIDRTGYCVTKKG
ncbi:MAG: PAS domain-containing protein, partial [Spirochaetales bacterium]|nr:PAS domain-containing protein [Spirochaetales bacterium]